MNRKIELYWDGIGHVELVDYLGSDLSVVNSARVSFGKHKTEIEEQDEKLLTLDEQTLEAIATATATSK